jgi:hypothetical protein
MTALSRIGEGAGPVPGMAEVRRPLEGEGDPWLRGRWCKSSNQARLKFAAPLKVKATPGCAGDGVGARIRRG